MYLGMSLEAFEKLRTFVACPAAGGVKLEMVAKSGGIKTFIIINIDMGLFGVSKKLHIYRKTSKY